MKTITELFAHLTLIEAFACSLGILMYWSLMYSNEKDKADDSGQPFPFFQWFKDWLSRRNDNIFAHCIVSGFFLYMGVDNLQAFLGESLSLPGFANQLGAAGVIGFFGSFIAAALKKLIKTVQ